MRIGFPILACLGLFAAGCAATPHPPEPAPAVPTHSAAQDGDAQSAALVFDPPVIQGERPLALSRDDRQAEIILGYQDQVLIFSDVHVRDEQRFQNGDSWYNRRAYSDTLSTGTR